MGARIVCSSHALWHNVLQPGCLRSGAARPLISWHLQLEPQVDFTLKRNLGYGAVRRDLVGAEHVQSLGAHPHAESFYSNATMWSLHFGDRAAHRQFNDSPARCTCDIECVAHIHHKIRESINFL